MITKRQSRVVYRWPLPPENLIRDEEIPDYPEWIQVDEEEFWTRHGGSTYLAMLYSEQGMEGLVAVFVSQMTPAQAAVDMLSGPTIYITHIDGWWSATAHLQERVVPSLPQLIDAYMERLL